MVARHSLVRADRVGSGIVQGIWMIVLGRRVSGRRRRSGLLPRVGSWQRQRQRFGRELMERSEGQYSRLGGAGSGWDEMGWDGMGIWSHCGKGKVCFSTWDSSRVLRKGMCAGMEGSTQGREEACFLGPQALIHVHIDPNAVSRETNQAWTKEPQRTARRQRCRYRATRGERLRRRRILPRC